MCNDGDGNEVGGENFVVDGFMSPKASRFYPDGLYLFWSYTSGERYVEVELDFPTNVTGVVPSVTALREFVDGEEVFHTDCSRGIVSAAPPGDRGGRMAGSFELMFVCFGPDGAEGTEDDEIRFLRYGMFEITGGQADAYGESCYDDRYRGQWDAGVVFEIWIDDYEDEETPGYYYYDEAEGCEGDTYDDEYDGGEGCEGDIYEDSDEYDSGCGGETWDSEGDGCEGDDWDSDSDGCEGDTSDSSGGCDCEGDTYYAGRKKKKPGGTSWAHMMPLLVPFFLRRLFGSKRKSRKGGKDSNQDT